MNRYFIKSNDNSDLVIVSPLMDEQPQNSILYMPNDFVKPIFDTYPNPTTVIEGATQQDILDLQKSLVPNDVALWKIRAVLANMGLEQSVVDAINALPNPPRIGALYIWNYGTSIERSSQTIGFIQLTLQLTDEQVDAIFINADAITL